MRDRVLDLAAIQDGSQHRAGRRALAVFADADAVTRAVQRRHLNEEQRGIRRRRRRVTVWWSRRKTAAAKPRPQPAETGDARQGVGRPTD